VREPYVSAIVEAFLTNGNGVAWAADEHYTAMISRFGPIEAEMALLMLFDPDISSKLRWTPARKKFAELMHVLPSKVTRPAASDLVDAIQSFSAGPEKIAIDGELKRLGAKLSRTVKPPTARIGRGVRRGCSRGWRR
jgi:hypothetical protein